MIVPQRLYGRSAWHIPGVRGKMSGSAMIGAITRIESKDIPQIITGAFRTTAGSAAEVQAQLLPTLRQVEQTTLEIILRSRTSPCYDEAVHTQDNHLVQSPLHRSSKVLPGNYHEKRQPYIVPPWWAPPFTPNRRISQ